MIYLILVSLMTTSSLFMLLNHPLSFGLILLIQTFFISILTGMMNLNFWFSYILFLVMVGGMLILFIYMTSVASNEKFKFSFKMLVFTIIMLFVSVVISFLIDQFLSTENLMQSDLGQWMNKNSSMNKYMNNPPANLMYFVIIYLLITLIMVVKITDIKQGPLRQKF
uniref:NADH-ubiquinone oxidoreductase chain 6 n=1 Tax=Chrysomeloidea sp. 7 KM-2017 TaxID=2219301 RepID=A0A346RHJ1_9CUCU|nr:NADH dehydrogenase subunit 6 [Chrysomeloidea sp. 7 KM-2017]